MKGVVSELNARLHSPEVFSSGRRLVNGILSEEKNKSPMAHRGESFNRKSRKVLH